MANDARRELMLYIRTTPTDLWQAITDPEKTRLYWYGTLNHSDWMPGSAWTSDDEDGTRYLDGEIIEIDQPHRLVQTFHISEGDGSDEPPSKLTWEITPMGDACRLRVIHEGLGPQTLEYVTGGWEYILSGLKTLLETGQPLKVGEAARM
jgi:uncharacterized protein YndB with AHSA1/START domain